MSEMGQAVMELSIVVSRNLLLSYERPSSDHKLNNNKPEPIYNSHYGNGVPAMYVYLLVLSSWKINIAKKPIAVMGL